MVAVGDVAPDFTLKDQNGNDVTLSELRGKPVVIVFYPFTFTGVCHSRVAEATRGDAWSDRWPSAGKGLGAPLAGARVKWRAHQTQRLSPG